MNVLITGTSSGIGFGLAQAYLKRGFDVYGVSRTCNHHLIQEEKYKHLHLDLSELEKIEESLSNFIVKEDVDLLILNAGVLSTIADMKDTRITDIKQVMDINVWSNKLIIDTVIKQCPHLKQVVAISSGASISGNRGWNAYALSKATLNMLIKLYADENNDIHFSAIAPGLVDTNMQDYICNLKKDNRFVIIDRLIQAKGTDLMPDSLTISDILYDYITNVNFQPSGGYYDIRTEKIL